MSTPEPLSDEARRAAARVIIGDEIVAWQSQIAQLTEQIDALRAERDTLKRDWQTSLQIAVDTSATLRAERDAAVSRYEAAEAKLDKVREWAEQRLLSGSRALRDVLAILDAKESP